jgi:hypothetical protein
MQTTADILTAISNLSAKHVLKNAPTIYQQAFADAAVRVYPANQRAKLLQDKFFIPNVAAFKADTFLQSASELSVQNHLVQAPRASNVAIEKEVNPPKDVDAYYEVGATTVSLEVKCAVEIQPPASSLVIKTAGRVPNHQATLQDLKGEIEAAHPTKLVEQGKNKDNTLKDFLLSAHGKFNPQSGCDDLNILLVACGYYFNFQEWYYYMFENDGLFTANSFHPHADYALVDMVILTNLKYCHTNARQFHDWTLKDVFILPFLNPRRRTTALSESIVRGLEVFNHHLKRYNEFTPTSDDPQVPDFILQNVKVNAFVAEHMSEAERQRYFPVKLTQ